MTSARPSHSGKKSNFAVSRWKSSAADRAPPPRPVAPIDPSPANPPRSLAERLPTMNETELLALQANATRVSQTDSRKQAEAAELLPLVAVQLELRKAAKLEAATERKKSGAAKRASTRASKLVEKAAREDDESAVEAD